MAEEKENTIEEVTDEVTDQPIEEKVDEKIDELKNKFMETEFMQLFTRDDIDNSQDYFDAVSAIFEKFGGDFIVKKEELEWAKSHIMFGIIKHFIV